MPHAALNRRRLFSKLLFGLCLAATALVVLVLALIVAYLTYLGGPAIHATFFTDPPSGDVSNPGGMRHAWQGTLILLALAGAIGIPLGGLAGIFLSEYSASPI